MDDDDDGDGATGNKVDDDGDGATGDDDDNDDDNNDFLSLCRSSPSSCRLSPCFPLPAAVVDCYVFVTPSLDFVGAGRSRRHP